ncbi:glycosyltransferase family 4 protein [Polynucleobacter paneuropaeus]|nr:glycosyltransferase family 4 protein [Polynucleobacter paneuropaeus]
MKNKELRVEKGAKILFISNLFPPYQIGGYEIACKSVFNLLQGSGYDCRVITSDFFIGNVQSGEGVDENVLRVLKLHHSWGGDYVPFSFDSTQKYNYIEIKKEISKFKPDLVYVWNAYGLGWKFLNILNEGARVPFVFHFMDYSIYAYKFTFKKYIAYILQRTTEQSFRLKGLIKNSIYISKFLQKKIGIDSDNIEVIYPFLETDLIPRKSNYHLKKKIRGVYVGQLEAHKGILFLCSTLIEFMKETGFDIELDIFGLNDGIIAQELILQYGNFIKLKTGIPREEILAGLKNYDVGFFPSLWDEPFGISQIEMMASGLPVISSGRGGSREVDNGGNIILYDGFNAAQLKDRLGNLLNDYPIVGMRIGISASKYVLKYHSKSAFLKALEGYFDRVISISKNQSMSNI